MATIKDVAARAGVSHGTVSNVLNGRGNVSAEKVELVTRTAREMGYQINNQASTLRAGNNRAIACILPDLKTERYQLFYDNFCREIRKSSDVDVDLYLTDDHPSAEQIVINKLVGKNYHHVITASSLNNATDYYSVLKTEPDRIFFVYRKPAGARVYICPDYYQAGNDIGHDLMRRSHDRVSVLAEQDTHQYVLDFISGLSTAIPGKNMIGLYSTSGKGLYRTAFEAIEEYPGRPVVVLDNEAFQAVTTAVMLTNPDALPLVYLLSADEYSFARNVIPYKMNYGKLGTLVAKKICGDEIPSLGSPVKNPGFSTVNYHSKKSIHSSSAPLNLLLLASPSSDALKKLLPHFSRSTGIKINVAEFTYEEINNILFKPEAHKNYDILRIDMADFPLLGSQIFMPLDEIHLECAKLSEGFDREIMKVFGKINNIRYALPFDPSAQLLFYRKDIFSNAMLSRLFYEYTGAVFNIPSTFDEFDRLLQFFSSIQSPGNTRRLSGTTVITGNSALIATEFLTRYYALGGRLLHENHSIHLENHKAILALEGYMGQLAVSLNLRENWWNSAVNLFQQGEVAMQISYMNQFNNVAQGGLSPSLGYTTVPGGVPQLGGGVIGVSRYSKNHLAAALFLEWFSSEEVFEQWVLLGGNGAQKSVFRNHQITGQYPWLSTLSECASKGVRETCFSDGTPFNLNHAEHIIGMGIRHAINGIMTIPEVIAHINQSLKN